MVNKWYENKFHGPHLYEINSPFKQRVQFNSGMVCQLA